MLTPPSERILTLIYSDLVNNLKIEMKKKLPSESILVSSLSIKSNDILRALKESSIEAFKIPNDALIELSGQNYIRRIDDSNRYAITAKGIWEIEKKKDVYSENSLIQYIDQKFFDKFEKVKPLNDRERMTVLALLATRAFSEEASADMKREDRIKDRWLTVLLQSYDFLKGMGLIKKLEKKEIIKDEAIEHSASHILRHNVDLPSKTSLIYTSRGDNRYYLDVVDSGLVSSNRISSLVKIIFEDKINIENAIDIENFCKDMAYDNAAYLFDLDTQIFINSNIDDVISEGINLVVIPN